MSTLRELKGRIGSVASSEKITGAMKMISSAKMHKAEGALKRLVPFRSQIETIIGNILGSDAEFSSPLMTVRPVHSVALVVTGSDDGLCGAFNINMAKYVKAHLTELTERYGAGLKVAIYPVGKKVAKACEKLCTGNVSMVAADGVDSKSEGEAVKQFTAMLEQLFTTGQADRVDVLYTHYYSAGRQRPTTVQLLPVSTEAFGAEQGKKEDRPYLFEPSADDIFRTALPMYLLSTMQEIFGENRASEQAARVMAMQSANDNAKKLLDALRLEYNKKRQDAITTELLDIVGGQVRD